MSRGRYKSTANASRLLPERPLDMGPDLPPHPQGLEWTRRAVALWERWRRSPARYAWVESDLGTLERLLLVEDMLARGGKHATAALFAEARQISDQLGLTPASRNRLGIPADGFPSGDAPGGPEDRGTLERRREVEAMLAAEVLR